MFKESVQNHLCVYDFKNKRCLPINNIIPWPLAWLLCSYNPKHIFIDSRKPSLDLVRQETIHLVNRLKHLQSRPAQSDTPSFVRYKRPFPTPPCRRMCSPDIEGWARKFRGQMIAKAKSVVKHAYVPMSSNIFPLLKIALRQLRHMAYIALPNDKGPGFALVTVSDFNAIEEQVMSRTSYLPVRPCDVPTRQNLCAAASAASRVESYMDWPGAAKTLNRSLYRGSFLASIGLQVKTHKPPGSVGIRNLHRSPLYPLEGLARWLTSVLQDAIPTAHFLRDSIQAKQRLHGLQVPTGSKIALCDLKDFFMSGDCMSLLADCTSALSGALKVLASEVLCLLLDSQYVTIQSNPECIFKVIEGSGMGLLFSGAVSNLAFYQRVEKHLTTSSALVSHGVLSYQRYHDDIVCVYRCAQLFIRFFQQMRHRAGYFKVLCTEVSSKQVRYLDLNIAIVRNRVEISPALYKPIIPLAPESGHSKYVHVAWPKAVSNRLHSLASLNDPNIAGAILDYYKSNNAAPQTLQVFIETMSQRPSSCPPSRPCLSSPEVRTLWLKVTAHPLWTSSFQSCIRRLQPPADANVKVRIAWRNSNNSLAHKIRLNNKRLLGGR